MSTAFYPSLAPSGGAAAELNPLVYRQPPRAAAASADEARRVGREFEAMFLSQMLQPMFETVETNGIFGGGYGERMFRSLHVDEFAKSLSRAGGIGLSDAIAREILRLQEKAGA